MRFRRLLGESGAAVAAACVVFASLRGMNSALAVTCYDTDMACGTWTCDYMVGASKCLVVGMSRRPWINEGDNFAPNPTIACGLMYGWNGSDCMIPMGKCGGALAIACNR